MSNLKPCPFCGHRMAEVKEIKTASHLFGVECAACNASTGWRSSKKKAVQAWNARTGISHAMQEEMLSMLLELQECSEYWSEYYVPIGLVDRLNAVITKAKGEKE